eukprot:GFUD01028972.1.p1 GENE.GFUD01028972.1~~GFUD01028972.1.p1  ORF type:complete len:425 (-),score=119.57 GFUD01028972.1:266-1441(-)
MVTLSGYTQWGEKEAGMEEELIVQRDNEDIKIRFKKSTVYQTVSLFSLAFVLLIIYLSISMQTDDVKSSETLSTFPVNVKHKDPHASKESEAVNDRPIIGVLTQELDSVLNSKLPPGHNYTSYLAASYVQWVQAGGARAVPVIIGREEEYYRQLFGSLNGLLLPGGSAPLTGDGGYAEVGELFFDWAKEANDNGDTFPIWGTCNGFELLTVLSSKDHSRLTDCDSQDEAVPLIFLSGWEESNLFSSAPPDVIKEITEEKITINFHNHCLTPTNFTKYGMEKFWNPLSYNYDRFNLVYLSTIEAKNYPFVGSQFHPEKNIFEWSEREPRIPHSRHAVHVSLYFATHFVNLARQSSHTFPDRDTEEQFLSYRYQPQFVGREDVDWTFEEAYLF